MEKHCPDQVNAALAPRPAADTRPVLLMAQDAGRFGRISLPRACWAPAGVRPTVRQQMVRESTYVDSAVAPALGQMTSLILPGVDTALLTTFLRHVADTCPNHFLRRQLDCAGWHQSADREVPENIRLIPPLPRSPELNPVEHGWEYLREHWLRTTCFATLEALIERLVDGLQALAKEPDRVKTMTNFPHRRLVQ
jgi:hypothetical protein